MGVSLELALSLRVPGPQVVMKSRVARGRRVTHDSPHGILGPFSTCSSGDPPTRGSIPASFRPRRWFGLDGLLSPGPGRLVSSDSAHGVPGRAVAHRLRFRGVELLGVRPFGCSAKLVGAARGRRFEAGREARPRAKLKTGSGRACHRSGGPGARSDFHCSRPVRRPKARGQAGRDRIRARSRDRSLEDQQHWVLHQVVLDRGRRPFPWVSL